MQRVLAALGALLVLAGAVYGANGTNKELSENKVSNVLKVERSNPYCNFQRLFGPMCNMTGYDGVLTIQPDAMLTNALEVAVVGARTILLYPTCVPWVKFYGAGDFLTSLHKSPEAEEENHNCRTWLRAFNSNISTLQSGIHDISLVNSSVHLINLYNLRDVKIALSNISSIEHLDWKGYKGEISYAKIDKVLDLECNDNLTAFGTHFGQIKLNGFSFNGRQLILDHTIIDEVYFQGILLNRGVITIENTIIRKVSREGIVISPDATLSMKNVTIENCQNPCIKSSFRLGSRYFTTENVTVKGDPIEQNSEAIQVTLDESIEDFPLLENDTHCHSESESLVCDFKDFDETVILASNVDSAISRVNISNAADLHVVEACEMDIVVRNSTGVYTEAASGRKLCESGEGTLTSINSTFNVFHVEDLKRLTSFHSNIDEIHAGNVNKLVSRDSGMKIRQITVTDKMNLFDSRIDIVNATITGTLQANATKFCNVSDLRIAGNASIENGEFKHLGIHSITVSGYLFLSHITVRNYDLLSIYVTESGKIELDQIVINDKYHFISAEKANQVVWKERTSEELRRLVAVRNLQIEGDGVVEAGEGEQNCTTIQSPMSNLFDKYDIFCNYSGVEDVTTVSVSLGPSILGKSLVIEGAKNVRMKEICTHDITLLSVTNASMDYVAHHCFYRLRAENSYITNIANEPTLLRINNSIVGDIETPFPMNSLHVYHSSIDSLLATPATTFIENSNISSLKMLMSHEFLSVKNSNIDKIESMQVFGPGALINVTINSISSSGILIDGHLLIENATINIMDRKAFTFVGEAGLSLVNVDIVAGSIESFNVSRGSVSLTNVTMFGAPLTNDMKVDRPKTTAVPVNKMTTAKVTSAPQTVSSSELPAKPIEHTTREPKSNKDGPGQRTNAALSMDQQTQPWVKWAAAGASIFLALVVVLIGLSLAVVVRTHRSGETFSSRLSRMFRAANDDELQLSTELDIHVGPERDSSTTHYSRLPSI